jgi:hypothetical protein
MRRSHRRNRRHCRPGPQGRRQKTRRASCRCRRPARRRPTSRTTPQSPPPHGRPRQTSLPCPHLSCTEADRSNTVHNLPRAGADVAPNRACRAASVCICVHLWFDSLAAIMPPAPARPEESRAEFRACLDGNERGHRTAVPPSRFVPAPPDRTARSITASLGRRQPRLVSNPCLPPAPMLIENGSSRRMEPQFTSTSICIDLTNQTESRQVRSGKTGSAISAKCDRHENGSDQKTKPTCIVLPQAEPPRTVSRHDQSSRFQRNETIMRISVTGNPTPTANLCALCASAVRLLDNTPSSINNRNPTVPVPAVTSPQTAAPRPPRSATPPRRSRALARQSASPPRAQRTPARSPWRSRS